MDEGAGCSLLILIGLRQGTWCVWKPAWSTLDQTCEDWHGYYCSVAV